MLLRSICIFIFFNISSVWTAAIQIHSDNIHSILSSNKLVLINFYANWCPFSRTLNPIYDQLAEKVEKEYSGKNVLVIGKVDCDADGSIGHKYGVKKYPTLKLFRDGLMNKREYRGARQLDAFWQFLEEQIQSGIVQISSEDQLSTIDWQKRSFLGYFPDQNSSKYERFVKVANLLRDDCRFIQLMKNFYERNEYFSNENGFVYYRSLNGEKVKYEGSLEKEGDFYLWSNKNCLPLIREMTFQNAEELTDEGLPFLILFHHPDDHQSIVLLEQRISQELRHQMTSINCLHADGSTFVHPLRHLGKTTKDLPLLVLDSFKDMFLFPDFEEISVIGKLSQFVKDFHSGKLHEDFHNSAETKVHSRHQDNGGKVPQSVFVRLTPSRQRYSFRDEL